MKVMLSSLIVLMLSTATWAQGDSPGCDLCVTVIDNTCTEFYPPSDCSSFQQLPGAVFTPNCSGTYNFWAKVSCSVPNMCYKCVVCAKVYNNQTNQLIRMISTAHPNTPCIPETCEVASTVVLTQYIEYRLEVNLLACDQCANCGSCQAKARVWYAGSPCTPW